MVHWILVPTLRDIAENINMNTLALNRNWVPVRCPLVRNGISVFLFFDFTDFEFTSTAPVNDRHGTVYPLDYGAVRARKRAALDAASAELAASISARPRPPPSSTAHTRVIRRRNTLITNNAIAGPSSHSVTDVDQIRADVVASCPEARLLTMLAGGDGISSYDMQGFIEKCSVCHMFYLGSILSVHILSCS